MDPIEFQKMGLYQILLEELENTYHLVYLVWSDIHDYNKY